MRSHYLFCAFVFVNSATRADVGGPQNLNFEKGTVGEEPEGWFAPEPSTQAGYTAVLSETNPKEGKRCAVVSRGGNDVPQGFGNLMQSFDATPWRGKRIRLKAWVRADVKGDGNQAQLWLRVDRKDEQPGFFDNMGDRPITKKEWTEYEIVGDIAADAEQIAIGLMLVGNGTAAIDGVTIEQAGKAGEGDEPAKALTDRQLDNLIAFAKLYGYVRYFHSSDEAAAANWETFLIEGVGRVKNAKTPDELAATLQKLFAPIAPTVRVVAGVKVPNIEPPPEKATLVAWNHFGVGTGGKASMYWSKRMERRAKEPFPDPAKPHVAELGGGVTCVVPLVLEKLNGATVPAAITELPESTKPKGFRPSGNDKATRLAAVIIAWNIFQHFYPYFDVVKTDWPAELKKALTTAATDHNERQFHLTLKRLVAALQDGHGGVYFQGSGGGTPLPVCWDWIEDKLVITRVPAKYAEELKAGDVVVKINGRAVKEVLVEQEALISGATPQWIRFNALRTLRNGAKDSEVALEIQRRAGVSKTVKVMREEGLEPEELSEVKPQKVEEVQPGIMYLDIDRCDDKDFQKALPKLETAKGIIFDLRGYPSKFGTAPIGHLSDKAVTCAQWHIPKTIYPDRKDVTFQFSNWKVPPAKPKWEAKVAFITDGRAISYAETYLGIIEHYKLAAIVGGPTAGTNGNVNPFQLPGGYSVSWTGMKVLKHDGSKHHGVGIQPTVPVKRTIQGVKEGKDELLEKAIETVKP